MSPPSKEPRPLSLPSVALQLLAVPEPEPKPKHKPEARSQKPARERERGRDGDGERTNQHTLYNLLSHFFYLVDTKSVFMRLLTLWKAHNLPATLPSCPSIIKIINVVLWKSIANRIRIHFMAVTGARTERRVQGGCAEGGEGSIIG